MSKQVSTTMEDIADTQIEMRMRSYGTGRWAAGLIKGISLIYNTCSTVSSNRMHNICTHAHAQ